MLKTTNSDAVSNADNHPQAAGPQKKRRRRTRAGAAVRQPAVKAAVEPRAAIPGVDVFGRVTHWNRFTSEARNDRRAHQAERADASQEVQRTQQQAELAAEAARARSMALAGGLARAHALREAIGVVGEAQSRPDEDEPHRVESSGGTNL